METKNELQAQENIEQVKEIYQPKPEIVCDLNDKACNMRLIEVLSDCV